MQLKTNPSTVKQISANVIGLALLFGLLVCSPLQSAQAQIVVEGHSILGLPMGDMAKKHSVGLGFELGASYAVPNQFFDVGLKASYSRYFTTTDLQDAQSFSEVLPVYLSVMFHPRHDKPYQHRRWEPYAGINMGVAVVNENLANTLDGGIVNLTTTAFAVNPRVGIRYKLTRYLDLDGFVEFTQTFSHERRYSWVNFGIGVNYTFDFEPGP